MIFLKTKSGSREHCDLEMASTLKESSSTLVPVRAHSTNQSRDTGGTFHLMDALYFSPSGEGQTRWVEPLTPLEGLSFLENNSWNLKKKNS